jgi:hypothetical protein
MISVFCVFEEQQLFKKHGAVFAVGFMCHRRYRGHLGRNVKSSLSSSWISVGEAFDVTDMTAWAIEFCKMII